MLGQYQIAPTIMMKRVHPSIVLLFTAIFAYGLLAPQTGFYWDDQPMSWIRYQLGPDAMIQYFSTNRPVWGLLYQVTTRIFPQVPVYWQVFALFWRWLGAVVVWSLVRELWKDRPRFAIGVSLFFLLYPGFNQQWGGYLYSHFFIVLFFFLLSNYLMLRRRTLAALIFSALNLWMMEYFFVLELARLGLIWTSLRDSQPNLKERLKAVLRLWTPYLALFALAVLSRLLIFNNQVYGFSLMPEFRADPMATLLLLLQDFLTSLWTVSVAAWGQVFTGVDPSVHGVRTVGLYATITLAVLAVSGLYILQQDDQNIKRRDAWYAIGLGGFMLPFAGVPFWTTGLVVSLAHPASRFTLPFMLGVSLILAGLLELISSPKIRIALVALLVGLAAGRQFLWSVDYLRDWQEQKNLFWQLSWRAPGIKPDTLLLINEELNFNADNSISAPLNWIYTRNARGDRIDYVLFYPTNRLNASLPSLESGVPIHYDYLAGTFDGNSSDALAFYYDPPGCLRLLEPEFDPNNRLIPNDSLMREASTLSNADRIVLEQQAVMPGIYGPEPEHGWCYYFQKADLARQFGGWDEVADLGDKAFLLDDHPNDPVERFVFIEGYAHIGDWNQAIRLSRESYRVSREYMSPLLCQLWSRIETGTDPSPERGETLKEVRDLLSCPEP